MIGYVAYLKRGGKTFRLDSGDFEIDAESFIPPATQEIPLLATGTSANRYGGSTKVSERAIDVELSLPVIVSGRSEAAVRLNAQRLTAFLKSGTKDEPAFFCWKGNDDIPYEPVWGQYGAPARYEIIHAGTPQVDDFYRLGDTRKSVAGYNATLLVKPYSQGIPQRLGSATGGILEDRIGEVDGRSRGLIVPEATTNKMTNPVFGHATWNNGWTADSGLDATENTDPAYLLPGTVSSARLSFIGVNNEFTQSINVGNTNTHTLTCYAKLPDGGVVSSTHLNLYYNTSLITGFTAVGDGWYRLSSSPAGINASTETGVEIASGQTVFVSGFQMEEKGYATPLCWGDLLHCTWAGTAHASTSTRTVARWRIPTENLLRSGEGTIRLAVRMSLAETRANDVTYFADTDGLYMLFFSAAGNTFTFFAGTTYVTSAAQTFNNGDILVFHCVYGNSGVYLYRDGVEIGDNSTVDADAPGTYLYLGSNESVGAHGNDTILDFTIFNAQVAAAEVLADFNNITEYISGGDGYGRPLSPIPWLWTKDGDDVVDNCNDSSRDDYGLVCGVPGGIEAITELYMTPSSGLGTQDSVWISNFATLVYVPASNLYGELSGTVDATCSGGEQFTGSVDTLPGGGLFDNGVVIDPSLGHLLAGKTITLLVRGKDAGSNLMLATQVRVGAVDLFSDHIPVVMSSSFEMYRLPAIVVPTNLLSGDESIQYSLSIGIDPYRSSGATANLSVDYYVVMPDPFVRLQLNTSGAYDAIYYHSVRGAVNYSTSANFTASRLSAIGRLPSLMPNHFNLLRFVYGDSDTPHAITSTITITKAIVTPRWGIH